MLQSDTISVLLIDDDASVLESCKGILEQEPGFSVVTRSRGNDALELLETRNFDVIISDYSMPDIDGIALLREVRTRGCRSLFVILTGKRFAHIAMDALNGGADFYIQKGAGTAREFSRLIEFIKEGVPRKNAEQELIAWERFYHSVVESDPDLVCRLLPDGSFTYVNEAGTRFFNKPYNDLIGKNLFALIPDDENSAVLARLQNIVAERSNLLLEHHIRTNDGISHLLQLNYYAFFGPQGTVTEYQVSGRTTAGLIRIGKTETSPAKPVPEPVPVPAPLQQETGVQQAESYNWKGLVDTIQSLENPAFAIDRTGTIIAWNPALEQLTGVNAARMVGKGQQSYAIPFYGKPAPMLVDHMFMQPGNPASAHLPGIKKVGDTYLGEMEHVTIQGRPMLLWSKGSPVYDVTGSLIAALEVITVGEPERGPDSAEQEIYLGGISSVTLKISGEGVGGAIAGAIGSSTGGYGVYVTDKRLFVIRNPDLNSEKVQSGQFGSFIMDELFGMTVDTSQKSIQELERLKIFEGLKTDIARINMKRPVLLSGYLTITMASNETFRVYIDHKKAFTHLEQLIHSFIPEKLMVE